MKIVAYTDPAGRFAPDAPYQGNEDVLYINEAQSLMVVADGMGGANAGEVASHVAVVAVRTQFEAITRRDTLTRRARQRFVERLMGEADAAIKRKAEREPDCQGMGSTMVLAWIVRNRLTVSWMGDSRAYLFRKGRGLLSLTEDHSVVQELVRQGELSYEETFGHPHGNIITRCLGNPNRLPEPETRHYRVRRGDIILLCSDGLTGVLRDSEIEQILAQNEGSLPQCRQALFAAAQQAGWTDNVTVALGVV